MLKSLKSKKEIIGFNKFRELYKILPEGSESESPDFIVVADTKRIGIELIELINEGNDKFSPAQRYSLEDRIVSKARMEFQKYSNKRVWAVIEFEINLSLSKLRSQKLACEIAESVYKNTRNLPDDRILYNGEIYEGLPPEIRFISFDIIPEMEGIEWMPMRSKLAEPLESYHLNRAVTKKEKRIPEYKKKVDEIYLLIMEGFLPKSWYWDHKDLSIDSTEFDKVFLLRLMRNELIVLK